MRLTVLGDAAVSPNLAAGDRTSVCAFPVATRLADGTVLALYRQGLDKHGADGRFLLQRSADRGATWSEPVVVLDRGGRVAGSPAADGPARVPAMAGLLHTTSGALLANFGVVEGLSEGTYMFADEARDLPVRTLLTRSEDGGANWTAPELLDAAPPGSCPTTKPFQRPDGTICMPLEIPGPVPGVPATGMVFSDDDGRSFGGFVRCACDDSGALALCDGHCAQLDDGRILLLLWTFRASDETTIDVHRCHSQDGGRTWSEPLPTGLHGQVTAPLELPGGSVLAASNRRVAPEGILIHVSHDGGATWDQDDSVRMWDAAAGRTLAEPVGASNDRHGAGIWAALGGFTFGTPDLTLLDDGTVLLIHYATLDGVTHIRAVRFRFDE